MADRVAAGKRARTSGHNFERKIVRLLKDRFSDRPWCKDIRRTDQSHYAIQPDVTGLPGLWIECQSAQPKDSNPAGKLAQATRDCGKGDIIPVAIINRKGGAGSRTILVYLTLASLLRITGVRIPRTQGGLGCHPLRRRVALQGGTQPRKPLSDRHASLELGDFLDLYEAGPLSSAVCGPQSQITSR